GRRLGAKEKSRGKKLAVDGQLAGSVRYGVLYTAELRCDAPSDPRCRTETYVRSLGVRSTVVVMGKAARQAAGLGA
ncbi:MAG TPA: hypothetical protein PKX06_14475, partial [Phenylobacterium sp.]|nr:hypothetical protein [Phenylobacterium sp.]